MIQPVSSIITISAIPPMIHPAMRPLEGEDLLSLRTVGDEDASDSVVAVGRLGEGLAIAYVVVSKAVGVSLEVIEIESISKVTKNEVLMYDHVPSSSTYAEVAICSVITTSTTDPEVYVEAGAGPSTSLLE